MAPKLFHLRSIEDFAGSQKATKQLLSDRDDKNEEIHKEANKIQQGTRALYKRKHLRTKVLQNRMKTEQIE